MRFTLKLITPDNGEALVVEFKDATLTHLPGFLAEKPDLTLTINRSDLEQTMMGAKTLEAQIKDGTAKVEGTSRSSPSWPRSWSTSTRTSRSFPARRPAADMSPTPRGTRRCRERRLSSEGGLRQRGVRRACYPPDAAAKATVPFTTRTDQSTGVAPGCTTPGAREVTSTFSIVPVKRNSPR